MISIPGLGGIWDNISGPIEGLIEDGFDAVVDYVWKPMRGWFGSVATLAAQGYELAIEASFISFFTSQKLFYLFENAPEIVAVWVVRGFLSWVEDVLALIESWIDERWWE